MGRGPGAQGWGLLAARAEKMCPGRQQAGNRGFLRHSQEQGRGLWGRGRLQLEGCLGARAIGHLSGSAFHASGAELLDHIVGGPAGQDWAGLSELAGHREALRQPLPSPQLLWPWASEGSLVMVSPRDIWGQIPLSWAAWDSVGCSQRRGLLFSRGGESPSLPGSWGSCEGGWETRRDPGS